LADETDPGLHSAPCNQDTIPADDVTGEANPWSAPDADGGRSGPRAALV